MKIEINIKDELDNDSRTCALIAISQIIGECELTKKETFEIFNKILTDIDERQRVSKDFRYIAYDY